MTFQRSSSVSTNLLHVALEHFHAELMYSIEICSPVQGFLMVELMRGRLCITVAACSAPFCLTNNLVENWNVHYFLSIGNTGWLSLEDPKILFG